MKKIFAGIGILVALFCIFFFLMVADKMVYHSNKTIYDFGLSKSISGQELKSFAEKAGITIRLVDFKNTSFGKKNLDITFINPDSTIQLGKRPSVFPNENIVYHIFDQTSKKTIKYFTVQEDTRNKIDTFKLYLENKGYILDILEQQPINFEIGMLFSSLNIGFFSFLSILLILSIACYYVYRLKHIGVLKLIGWSNIKISFGLLFELIIQLYLFSLVCIIPFGIYIVISDVSKIVPYIQIYFLLCLFLAFVFLLSACVGISFISNVNQIVAIKNKKNNRLIFVSLLIFKVATTIFLVLSMNNSIDNISILNSTIETSNELAKYDFYKIRTSIVPEDSIHKKLDQSIGSLDDESVFNYSSPEQLINITKLNSYKSSRKFRDINECVHADISPNILKLLNISDVNGNKVQISQKDLNEITLLIPIHFKNNIEKILDYYQLGKDTNIIYIQNCQIHSDLLIPGLYVYDSIYRINRLQKVLYLNNGEVLLNKKSAKKIEHTLISMGLDKYSITVESMNMEYDNRKANVQLDLIESVFHLVINIGSFLLCVLSLISIFLELRKKEFGVYKLIGKYPMVIGKFLALNFLITLLIAVVINPIFLFLLLIEGTIYGILICKYIRSKAVLALKGE